MASYENRKPVTTANYNVMPKMTLVREDERVTLMKHICDVEVYVMPHVLQCILSRKSP